MATIDGDDGSQIHVNVVELLVDIGVYGGDCSYQVAHTRLKADKVLELIQALQQAIDKVGG